MPRTTRKPAQPAGWTLVSEDIKTATGVACLWQHEDGSGVVLAPGVDPNQTPPAAAVAPSSQPSEGDPEEAADRIAVMMAAGRSQEAAKVRLQKWVDGAWAHCGNYSPEEFERGGTLDFIRKLWKGGKYKIELYATNPATGRFTYRNSQMVTILEPTMSESAAIGIAPQLEQLAQRIETALAPRDQRSEIDRLKETFALMSAMRDAMGLSASGPAKQPNIVELVGQLVGAMKGARELAQTINAPENPPSLLETLAPKAMDIVQAAMTHKPMTQQVALPPSIAAAPANGARPPASIAALDGMAAAAAIQNGVDQMGLTKEEVTGLRVAIGTLNNLAFFQMDADAAAAMIWDSDQLPDDVFTLLKQPDWFAQMARVEPSCQRWQSWYEKVHTALLRMLAEDEALPDSGAGAAAP